MLPFENLILIDKEQAIPVFRQITDRMIGLIRDGSLKPGVFLPGTRQMAQILCVNRKTIIKSYDEMLGQNWIETIMRKGYRVMLDLPLIKPRSFQPRTSFVLKGHTDGFNIHTMDAMDAERSIRGSDILVDDGFPDPILSPYREINKTYAEEDRSLLPRQLLPTRPQGGTVAAKEATSTFLNDSRALNITAREIIMTRGGKMPLYLAANILVEKGDVVALSDKSDTLTKEIFEHAGAQIVEVVTDEQGIQPRSLEEILSKKTIKLLYLVPHCHYPTTAVMSSERRRKLLSMMTAYDFWIIEDDNGYDFHHKNSPILPIASLAHNGKLIYIGSFDRVISSCVRVGFFVASPEVIGKAIRLQGLIDQHGDIHMEHMLLRMIENGGLERHIMRSKKMYTNRCGLICGLLEQKIGHLIDFTVPEAGLAVYIRFDDHFPIETFINETSSKGLFFNAEIFHDLGHNAEKAIRFGFASLSAREIERAVDIMAKAICKLDTLGEKNRLKNVGFSAMSA